MAKTGVEFEKYTEILPNVNSHLYIVIEIAVMANLVSPLKQLVVPCAHC